MQFIIYVCNHADILLVYTPSLPLYDAQDSDSVLSHTNTVNSHFTAANLQRATQLASEQREGGAGIGSSGAGGTTNGMYSTTFGTTASGYEGGGGAGGGIMLRYVCCCTSKYDTLLSLDGFVTYCVRLSEIHSLELP